MSTVDRPRPAMLPPLVAGQRLDQPTFHARYAAMPPETRAELVGGVVYMPSPLGYDHGVVALNVCGWMFHYKRSTPGIGAASRVTVKLGRDGEVQPDAVLRLPDELGGRSHVDADGYLAGAPELVVEGARSSRQFDLGPKKDDYERAGVREYLVVEIKPDGVHWFVRRDDRFAPFAPGPDGIFRSEVFPDLWLDPAALFAADLSRLIHVLDLSLATPEHAAFAAGLARAPVVPPAP